MGPAVTLAPHLTRRAARIQFIKGGGDMEFDGGDSGGGVVGDGNTDLEDQHNSPSMVRGGFGSASVSDGGSNVGHGSWLKVAPTFRASRAPWPRGQQLS